MKSILSIGLIAFALSLTAQHTNYRYCYPRYHSWSVSTSYELELRPHNSPLHILNFDASFNRKRVHITSGIGLFKDHEVSKSSYVEYMQYSLILHEILDTTYVTGDGDKVDYFHEVWQWDSVPGARIIDQMTAYSLIRIPLYFTLDLCESHFVTLSALLGGSFVYVYKIEPPGAISLENASILNQKLLNDKIRDFRTNFQAFSGIDLKFPITESLLATTSCRLIYLGRPWYASLNKRYFSYSWKVGLTLIL